MIARASSLAALSLFVVAALAHCGGGTSGTSGPSAAPKSHVESAPTCHATRPPEMTPHDGGAGEGGVAEGGVTAPQCGVTAGCCSSDADCTKGKNGRCHSYQTGNQCTYDECVTSADCSAGNSCLCDDDLLDGANHCVPSDCRSDADCGSGGFCSPTPDSCGLSRDGVTGFYCHTPKDECNNDSDCGSSGPPSGYCMYSKEAAHWVCAGSFCSG
jgi:hypothetical protein